MTTHFSEEHMEALESQNSVFETQNTDQRNGSQNFIFVKKNPSIKNKIKTFSEGRKERFFPTNVAVLKLYNKLHLEENDTKEECGDTGIKEESKQ